LRTTTLSIDVAGDADLPRILAREPRVQDPPGRRGYRQRGVGAGECFVARDGDRIDGFAVFDRSFFEYPFIALLYVEPSRRRRGIAAALIRHIESICPGDRLFTSTNESNIVMQRVCEALGFTRSGYIENLDEGDPELVYVRRLAGPTKS
jgi:GNAT superfamily N-acetyltransferase